MAIASTPRGSRSRRGSAESNRSEPASTPEFRRLARLYEGSGGHRRPLIRIAARHHRSPADPLARQSPQRHPLVRWNTNGREDRHQMRYVQEWVPLAEARGMVSRAAIQEMKRNSTSATRSPIGRFPSDPRYSRSTGRAGSPSAHLACAFHDDLSPQDFNWEKSLTVTPWQENMDSIALPRLTSHTPCPTNYICQSSFQPATSVVFCAAADRLLNPPKRFAGVSRQSLQEIESVCDQKRWLRSSGTTPDPKRADAKNSCAAAAISA